MQTKSQLNGLRLAPRKVRAVVDLVRKKDVLAAMDQLDNFIKRPAPQLLKLLQSAVASAENNFQMVKDNLYIKEIFVNEGVKLKRFTPVAQGRATEIQKKTSLVTLILDEKVPGLKRQVNQKSGSKEKEVKAEKEEKKPEIKKELGTKAETSHSKKVFSRKAI
jgi:large subunit ribosomal protein L22